MRVIVNVVKSVACIGLDLSLNGTGVALFLDDKLADWICWTDLKRIYQKDNNHFIYSKCNGRSNEITAASRMKDIMDGLSKFILSVRAKSRACYVAIEGYAYSANFSRSASGLHELCGCMKLFLTQQNIPFRVYDIDSIKLASTGYGRADKEAMVIAAEKLVGMNLKQYEGAGENVADAIMLANMLKIELALKAGTLLLVELPERLRRVFIRVSKVVPEAFVSREFIKYSDTGRSYLNRVV